MSFWCRSGACSNKRPSSGRPKTGTKLRLQAGVPAALCAAGLAAYAQDAAPPGIAARFDVTQRLEFSDNPDFDVDGSSDLFGRTILGFSLDSVTPLQNFNLDLNVDIEEGRDNRDSLDLTNATVALGYLRQTRNALVGTDISYREADANSGITDDEIDLDGNVINQNDGTRQTLSYGLEAALGREAPVGASFAWRYRELTFSGTDDPDLRDSSTNDLSGQIDFRFSPRITASLVADLVESDTSGTGVDRKTTGLGTELQLDISRLHRVDLFLGYDRIERSGTQTGTDEGLSGSIDWTRQMTNGEIGLGYRSEVASNSDGRRSFLSAVRNMELPRGALDLELGLTGSETVGSDPLVDITYRHERPRGLFTLGMLQSVNTDDDNDEEIITRLRASYDHRINTVSSFGLSGAFFDRNELDAAGNDAQRIDIDLTYRYDLTRDWGLVSGFRHSMSTEDSGRDRTENSVFVGLQRSFDWTP